MEFLEEPRNQERPAFRYTEATVIKSELQLVIIRQNIYQNYIVAVCNRMHLATTYS